MGEFPDHPAQQFDDLIQRWVAGRSRLPIGSRSTEWRIEAQKAFAGIARHAGLVPILADPRRKTGAMLWDAAACAETDAPPKGLPDVPPLAFPRRAYTALVAVMQAEWGVPGKRRGTRVWKQNMEEVLRDSYKLLDARCRHRFLLYSTWSHPDQAGADGRMLQALSAVLGAYASHQSGDTWLFVELDDEQRLIRGYGWMVPKRGGIRQYQPRLLGQRAYPARWSA